MMKHIMRLTFAVTICTLVTAYVTACGSHSQDGANGTSAKTGGLTTSTVQGEAQGGVSFELFEADAWYVAPVTDEYEEDYDGYLGMATIVYRDSASLMLPTLLQLRDSVIKCAFLAVGNPAEAAQKYFATTVEEIQFDFKQTDKCPDTPDSLTVRGGVTISGGVAALMPKYISYCINTFSYVPMAAHPLSFNNYIVAELPSGRVLKLSDLVTPQGMEALPGKAQAIAREQRLPVDNPPSTFPLPGNNNFYIAVDGGLVLAYNVYEIASYAAGPIDIKIYGWQIEQYLTPKGRELLIG